MNYRDVAHSAAQGKSPQKSLLPYSPVRSPTPVPPGRPLPVQRLPGSPTLPPTKIPGKVPKTTKGSLKVDAAKVLRSRDPTVVQPKVHLPSALRVDMASVLKNRQKNVKSPTSLGAAGTSSQSSHPLSSPLAVISENPTPGVHEKKLSAKSLPVAKMHEKLASSARRETSQVSTALSAMSVPVAQKEYQISPLTSPEASPNVSVTGTPHAGSPTSLTSSISKDASGKSKKPSPTQHFRPAHTKTLETVDSCQSLGSGLQLDRKRSPSFSIGSQALTTPTLSPKSSSPKESQSSSLKRSVLSPIKVGSYQKPLSDSPEKDSSGSVDSRRRSPEKESSLPIDSKRKSPEKESLVSQDSKRRSPEKDNQSSAESKRWTPEREVTITVESRRESREKEILSPDSRRRSPEKDSLQSPNSKGWSPKKESSISVESKRRSPKKEEVRRPRDPLGPPSIELSYSSSMLSNSAKTKAVPSQRIRTTFSETSSSSSTDCVLSSTEVLRKEKLKLPGKWKQLDSPPLSKQKIFKPVSVENVDDESETASRFTKKIRGVSVLSLDNDELQLTLDDECEIKLDDLDMDDNSLKQIKSLTDSIHTSDFSALTSGGMEGLSLMPEPDSVVSPAESSIRKTKVNNSFREQTQQLQQQLEEQRQLRLQLEKQQQIQMQLHKQQQELQRQLFQMQSLSGANMETEKSENNLPIGDIPSVMRTLNDIMAVQKSLETVKVRDQESVKLHKPLDNLLKTNESSKSVGSKHSSKKHVDESTSMKEKSLISEPVNTTPSTQTSLKTDSRNKTASDKIKSFAENRSKTTPDSQSSASGSLSIKITNAKDQEKLSVHSYKASLGDVSIGIKEEVKVKEEPKKPKADLYSTPANDPGLSKETLLSREIPTTDRRKVSPGLDVKVTVGRTNEAGLARDDTKLKKSKIEESPDTTSLSFASDVSKDELSETSSFSKEKEPKDVKQLKKDKKEVLYDKVSDKKLKGSIKGSDKVHASLSKGTVSLGTRGTESMKSKFESNKELDKAEKQSSKTSGKTAVSQRISSRVASPDKQSIKSEMGKSEMGRSEMSRSQTEEVEKVTSPKYRISVMDMVNKKVRAKAMEPEEAPETSSIDDKSDLENLRSRIIITTDDGVTPKTRSVTVGLEKMSGEVIEKTVVSARQSRSRIKKDASSHDKSRLSTDYPDHSRSKVKNEHQDKSRLNPDYPDQSRAKVKGEQYSKKPPPDSKERSRKIDNISALHEPHTRPEPSSRARTTSIHDAHAREETSGRTRSRTADETTREIPKPSKLKGLFHKIDNVVANLESYMEIDPHKTRFEEPTNIPPKGKSKDKEKEKSAVSVKTNPNDKVRAKSIMSDDTEEPASHHHKSRKLDRSMTDAEDRRKKNRTIQATARRKTRDDESILRKTIENDHQMKSKKTVRKGSPTSQTDSTKPGTSDITFTNKQNVSELGRNLSKDGESQKQIRAKIVDKKSKDFGNEKSEQSLKNESIRTSPKAKQEPLRVGPKTHVITEAETPKYQAKVMTEKLKSLHKGSEEKAVDDLKGSKHHGDKKSVKEGFGDGEAHHQIKKPTNPSTTELRYRSPPDRSEGRDSIGKISKGQKPGISGEKLDKKDKKYPEKEVESLLKAALKPHLLPKGDDVIESAREDETDCSLDFDEADETPEVSCMGDAKQTPEPSIKSQSSSTTTASTVSIQSNKTEKQSLSEQSTEHVTISTAESEHSPISSHFAMAVVNAPPVPLASSSASASVPQSNMVRSVCNLSSSFKRFICSQKSQDTVQRIPENRTSEEQTDEQDEGFAVAVVTKKSNWMNQNVVVQSLDKISSSLRRLVVGDRRRESNEQEQQLRQRTAEEIEEERLRKLRAQGERKQKIENFQKKLSEKIFQVVKKPEVKIESTSQEGSDLMSGTFEDILLPNCSSQSEKMQTSLTTPQMSITLVTSDSSSGEGIVETSTEVVPAGFSKATNPEIEYPSLFGAMSVISATKEVTESEESGKNDKSESSAHPSHFAIAVVKNDFFGKVVKSENQEKSGNKERSDKARSDNKSEHKDKSVTKSEFKEKSQNKELPENKSEKKEMSDKRNENKEKGDNTTDTGVNTKESSDVGVNTMANNEVGVNTMPNNDMGVNTVENFEVAGDVNKSSEESNKKVKSDLKRELNSIRLSILTPGGDTKEIKPKESTPTLIVSHTDLNKPLNAGKSTLQLFEELLSQPSTVIIETCDEEITERIPFSAEQIPFSTEQIPFSAEQIPLTTEQIPPIKTPDVALSLETAPEMPFVTLLSGSFAVNGPEIPPEMSVRSSTVFSNQGTENDLKDSIDTVIPTDTVRLFSTSQLLSREISADSQHLLNSITTREGSTNSITVLKLDSSMSAKAGSILSAVLGATGNDMSEETDQGPSTSSGIRVESNLNDEYTITILVMEPTGGNKAKRKRPAEHSLDRTLDKLLSSLKTMVNKRKSKNSGKLINEDSSQSSDDGVFSVAMILMDSSETSAEVSPASSSKRLPNDKTETETNIENTVKQKVINMSKITSWSQVKELNSEEFSEVIDDTNVEDNQESELEVSDDFLDIEMMASELKHEKENGDRFK